jgi:transcriptional regulator with XRE-family HTH domain
MAKPDGRIIRSLRRKRGLRQSDLARIAGVSDKTIKRLEGGLTEPLPDTVAAVAGALKVATEALFQRMPTEPEPPAEDFGRVRSSFVGRRAQLSLLSERLAEARAGRAQVVWVAGEPGAGKSALMDELILRARASGFGVVKEGCYESPGAPSFWCWEQIFGALTEGMSFSDLERIVGKRRRI